VNNFNKEVKEYVRDREKGECARCGKYCWNNGNVAHRIAQSKTNIKKFGKHIIDHKFNKIWTCYSWLCNDSYNIGMNPDKSMKLISLIENFPEKNFEVKVIDNYIGENDGSN
jgi:hypothetical protein